MLRNSIAATIVAFFTMHFGSAFAIDACTTSDLKARASYILAPKKLKWPNNKVTVSFLNGTWEKDEVKKYAPEWSIGTGLQWVFVKSNGQIRISFVQGGSRSYVGTEALDIKDEKEPTMWLDLNNLDDGRRKRTILHEFGHAAGLLHEHQHPKSGLEFDKKKIFAFYKETDWCKKDGVYIEDLPCYQKVEDFITDPVNPEHACPGSPEYHRESVMIYPFDPSWLKPTSTAAPQLNLEISPADRDCVRSMYKPSTPVPPMVRQPQSQPSYCWAHTPHHQNLLVRAEPDPNLPGHYLSYRSRLHIAHIEGRRDFVRARSFCEEPLPRWYPPWHPWHHSWHWHSIHGYVRSGGVQCDTDRRCPAPYPGRHRHISHHRHYSGT